MNMFEIVKKLIGEIDPIGESHTDEIRYDNLVKMCNLANDLILHIYNIKYNTDRQEASMKKSGKLAVSFIYGLRDYDD